MPTTPLAIAMNAFPCMWRGVPAAGAVNRWHSRQAQRAYASTVYRRALPVRGGRNNGTARKAEGLSARLVEAGQQAGAPAQPPTSRAHAGHRAGTSNRSSRRPRMHNERRSSGSCRGTSAMRRRPQDPEKAENGWRASRCSSAAALWCGGAVGFPRAGRAHHAPNTRCRNGCGV